MDSRLFEPGRSQSKRGSAALVWVEMEPWVTLRASGFWVCFRFWCVYHAYMIYTYMCNVVAKQKMKLSILCKILSAPGVLRVWMNQVIHDSIARNVWSSGASGWKAMMSSLDDDVLADDEEHFLTTSWMWALLDFSMKILYSLFMIKLLGLRILTVRKTATGLFQEYGTPKMNT